MAEKNHGGRPRLFNTHQQLEDAVSKYFSSRNKYTITGLAYHLGFESRQSFYDNETIPEFSYIIKKARLRVEMGYEERLAENNVAGAIFALKNMGWRDKVETELTGKDGHPIEHRYEITLKI